MFNLSPIYSARLSSNHKLSPPKKKTNNNNNNNKQTNKTNTKPVLTQIYRKHPQTSTTKF